MHADAGQLNVTQTSRFFDELPLVVRTVRKHSENTCRVQKYAIKYDRESQAFLHVKEKEDEASSLSPVVKEA